MMIISTNILQAVVCSAIVAFTVAIAALAAPNDKYQPILNHHEPQSQNQLTDDLESFRLPKTLKPLHYAVRIHPNLENDSFTGEETITISVIEATNKIVLHSIDADVSKVSVDGFAVNKYYFDEKQAFLIIDLTSELQPHTEIKLNTVFNGSMHGKLSGLYSSSYLTPEKEKRKLATTLFASIDARQAFPCFDEPAMKAQYTITIVYPNSGGYHALSNMNEASSQVIDENTKEAHFATSVPMSTYLVCFIVSDLLYKTKTVNTQGIGTDFDIRVFATAHQMDKVDFALNTAIEAMNFYLPYFKVPYPLPKLDMIAIPDFSADAMENWGLITYRETALLYNESIKSTWDKQRVATVVCHELAHMWFGNLVTMDFWEDVWLNEGFATYMQFKCVNAIHPDWNMNDQFLIDALHYVLEYDASPASHKIREIITIPEQILEVYDKVNYEKGASIIRMVEDVVGTEKFEKGVTNYLNAFAYKNAKTEDFVGVLKKLGVDFDISLFMRTWTEQMGFPVIEVKRATPTSFVITQKRFFNNIDYYNTVHDDSEFNYRWEIPLTYRFNTNSEIKRVWFNMPADRIDVVVPADTKWIKFNAYQTGYYRVNYDVKIWSEIIKDLVADPKKFDATDRTHLLNDIFALADAGQLSYDVAMNITNYLPKETEFVPWFAAIEQFKKIKTLLSHSDIYPHYLKFARKLFADVYEQFNWEPMQADHNRKRLRVSILSAACAHGLPECLAEASNQFNKWLQNPENRPEPDLREIIYYYGMQTGGNEDVWNQVWQLFVDEQDASEKNKLINGLSAIQEPALLRRFIESAYNENYVRRQDYYTCMGNIAANSMGEPLVWDYVRENWLTLAKHFWLGDRYFGRMVATITQHFATQTKLDEVKLFFAKYPDAGAGANSRKQALETVKANIQWLKLNKETLGNWLKQNADV